MTHILRYFLPSQVRGVYRFDETFGQVDDASYNQFAVNKLRFLPCSLIEPIRRCVDLEEDFDSVSKQLSLDVALRGANSRRVRRFFNCHQYFHNALHGAEEGADNYLEVQFVKKILAPLLNETGLDAVQPQKQIGPYSVDFAIAGTTKLALEVDGFGKFSQRQDLDNFIERQNYITCQGWKIIRFTYGQIMHSTKATLRVLRDIFAADPDYQEFLVPGLAAAPQPRQANLFDIFRTPVSKQPNVFDLVNGFYHIQDWFAQLAIENSTPGIVLRDDLDFRIPLVGLALSSLYSFLDAVAKVVDVEFDLPTVKVCTPAMASKWQPYLHPDISVISVKPSLSAKPVTRDGILNFSAFLPSPLRSEESISFRSGLSLEEIHQHLDYITHEVFGYSEGTNRFQDKVLQRIFDGKETLGISTTGSGKSFCFWLPALLKPGLTLVIAPLRSLMRDQRLTLLNYGVSSMEFINSDVKPVDQRRFMEEAKLGYLRLLYISPERLRIKKFVNELEELQKFVPVNILAIDEAHCISEWGHDFRPSYLKLPSKRLNLTEDNPALRLLALTATAGQQVEKDMRHILKLSETDVVREPMADRERFSYQIIAANNGDSKTAVFRKVLEEDLSTALKQESLSTLLEHHNNRQEKTVGVVFCIYANPHGKNALQDGTSHYLFETMGVLEPDKVFMARQGRAIYPKYSLDGFADGRVRAFSSKPPTLCPQCHSYAYTALGNRALEVDDFDDQDNNEPAAPAAGLKVCIRCGHKFHGDQALSPPEWETLIKRNQNDFKEIRFDILVATKGFGMGIDKSSVRFVIHTSLSSGIESWYQEVGRAGRDNERAHIVLLADPPNDSCRSELEKKSKAKRPQCSWTGGCRHGRQSICDYGKQHIFITGSYPGPEADAIYALRMLDKLLSTYGQTGNNPIPIPFRFTDEISRPELALYRLLSLGLIEDYTIVYGGKRSQFELILKDTGKRGAIYYKKQRGKPRRSFTLRDCLSRVFQNQKDPERRNIERIADLRDEAVHLVFSEVPRDVLCLFQACVLNYHKRLDSWFGLSLADRVPVGMMTIVYDLQPQEADLRNARLRKELGKDAAQFLASYCAEIRREFEQFQRAPEFSIGIEYRLVLTKKQDEADIALSSGPSAAPPVQIIEVPKDPSKSHPFRRTEVLAMVKEAIPGGTINQHDIQCVNKVYGVKKRPEFFYQGKVKGSPAQYSQAFVDWLIKLYQRDAACFQKTRAKAKEQQPSQGPSK